MELLGSLARRSSHCSRHVLLAFLLITPLGCVGSEGGEGSAPQVAAVKQGTSVTGGAAASAVVRVTPEAFKASLVRQLARSSTGLVTERLPGGGTIVRTGGSFNHMSIGYRNPDGSFGRTCVGSPQEAELLMNQLAQQGGVR